MIGSGEIRMYLGGLLRNHENRNVYEGSPPQDLSEARWAGFFGCLLLIRRGGVPSGAAAIIVNEGVWKNLVSYLNSSLFIGNTQ
jgi:hypothetical protein